METNKFKNLEHTSLKNEVESMKKEYLNLKMSVFSGQMKDFSQFKKLRRNIARAFTHLREKEINK
jgi:ribosomal protein L29